MNERTLVLAKPDAVTRGLIGEVIQRLERRGLRLAAMKMIWIDEGSWQTSTIQHIGKPFSSGLVQYITSLPVVAMVWEGPSAIAVVRHDYGAD